MIRKNVVVEKGKGNTIIEQILYKDNTQYFNFFVLDLNRDGILEVILSNTGFLTVYELYYRKSNAFLG